MLLLIFGVTLRWLPMGNRFPISISGDYTIWERIEHLILPTITLGSFSVATFSRFMRASLLDVLGQDYVRTARAKGLSDRLVWFRHASRNALIPIATLLGPAIPGVITGAVLTETIYAWPGMGLLIVDSIRQRDYPVIMAIVLLSAMATILGYLISDILYAIVDPRIRLN
jgi:peptide/nickel transport system permease protein